MPGKRSVQTTGSRFGEATERLRSLLPPGWLLTRGRRRAARGTIRIESPAGGAGDITLWTADRLDPKAAADLPQSDGPVVVAAPWLSPRTRELLDARDIGYLDDTGNTKVLMAEPGLYIRTQGADRDPAPKPVRQPSLRGPRVWALLRTLAEVAPPYGVRDLSAALGIDAGYVSRVVRVLGDELLIERNGRGPIIGVDWERVIRQLAGSYSLFGSNETRTWIAPAGPAEFVTTLSGVKAGRWAVTGSFPSSMIAPVAAPELAVIFTDQVDKVARAGRLLPATTGANVVTAAPYDQIVYDRTWTHDGLPCVSLAQLVIDDLTGNGRMPSEGEALLGWMRRNMARWQAPGLTRPAPHPTGQ